MDIRLKQLSYSSRLTLHSCPKKYQLYKLNSTLNEADDSSSSVTFSYGHVVGLGIQNCLQDLSEDTILFNAFMMWDCDLFDRNDKQNKSFFLAVSAIQRFIHMRQHGFLEGYQLATHDGKPAVELSFIITFPDGFTYKGFVDAVLVHQDTGEVMVLEVKTTSSNYIAAATFKNSAQAIGYSIVLDVMFPKLSSYKVKYLIYKTKSNEYEVMDFEKDYLARALWIREILLDIDTIKMYEAASIYPMHGESCNDFFHECEYLNLCTLSISNLTKALTEEEIAAVHTKNAEDFQIDLSIHDLIIAQLDKEISTEVSI